MIAYLIGAGVVLCLGALWWMWAMAENVRGDGE